MWSSEAYFEKLLEGWERSETPSGIPYYINHNSEKTQWDHPIFVKTLEELVDMENVKYAAYRTAMKLRFIQKRLRLDLVDVRSINSVFDRHGYLHQNDTVIDCPNLYSVLVDIFNMTRKQSLNTGPYAKMSPENTAELVLNWLLNLYDMNRTGCIRVLSIKIGLATMCAARLSEKYRYFFKQLCGPTNYVVKKKMNQFLHDIMQVPEMVQESTPFGGLNVTPAVDSCFTAAWSQNGVTEDEFVTWLLREPQTIVWLPTAHRMAAAETVSHESKCNICKAYPIIGFRYKCLKCFNYDLCQMCFFTGRTSKKHKLKHPTQEYCMATTTKEDTKDFMKTIRNNLSRKHRNKKKLRYLPIYGTEQPFNTEDFVEEEAEEELPRAVPKRRGRKAPPGGQPVTDYVDAPQVAQLTEQELEARANQTSQGLRELEELLSKNQGIRPEDLKEYENMIMELENENKELIDQLEVVQSQPPQMQLVSRPDPYDVERRGSYGSDSESSEVGWLRDEKERLEAKQDVLESHNKQLEMQLQKLRMLITQGANAGGAPREALSPLSQNLRTAQQQPRSPQHAAPLAQPPPYQPSPNSKPLSQSMLATNPIYQSRSPRQPTQSTPANPGFQPFRTLDFDTPGIHGNSTHALEVDTTYGYPDDPALAQTHYSLPSPNHSRDFPDEEAELEELMDKLDKAYPLNMTHPAQYQSDGTMEDMYRAANRIGQAFSGFAPQQHPRDFADDQYDENVDYHQSRSHHGSKSPCFYDNLTPEQQHIALREQSSLAESGC